MKRSKCLLISAIIGSLYLIFIMSCIYGTMAEATDAAEQLGVGIGAMLIAPHIFLLGLAVLFNWIGFAVNARWAALTGGILYSVSTLVFIMYFIFEVPSIVLSFVGFAKLKDLPRLSGDMTRAKECVYCGAERTRGELFNKYGFCSDCKENVTTEIRSKLAMLAAAVTRLNPADTPEYKWDEAAKEVENCLRVIDDLEDMRKRVPMFKSSTREYQARLLAYRATYAAKKAQPIV